jgi:hypothetical protein
LQYALSFKQPVLQPFALPIPHHQYFFQPNPKSIAKHFNFHNPLSQSIWVTIYNSIHLSPNTNSL